MKRNSFIARVIVLLICLVMVVGGCGVQPSIPNNSQGNQNSVQLPIPPTTDGDADGPYLDINGPVDPDAIYVGSTKLSQDSLVCGTLTNGVVIGSQNVGAVVPADVKVSDGASNLTLSIKGVENNPADFGSAQLVQSLDVHVDGVASDNKVPMIVNLGAILSPELGETELKLYHTENGVPVLMTRVNSTADFAIHNQYTYNPETGEVSIYVASFSIFSATISAASVWDGTSEDTSWYDQSKTTFTLENAAQFAGFRKLVDEGNTFAGKTVKLGVDINLDNKLFDPIGKGYDHLGGQVFKGVFDGQNHTVFNLYQNGWELDPDKTNYSTYTYSTAGGGLFASIKDATIQYLTISGANIVYECVDMGVVVGYAQGTCHFEGIVVTNSTIANYNRATGGVVGEVCFGPYGTDTEAGYSHTFKNVLVDSSVVVSSLWGSFDTSCGGVIGAKWGDATVSMTNVIVAAELDVFSDVTAAYQWYAYRRCGMILGNTEQSSPKKAENAAAEFLTCDKVDVYYGDWTNYNYYQYANQDSDTGRRYPWVRAEEGLNNDAFSNPRYGVPAHGGVAITDENKDEYKTDYAAIKFDQLYGGGQGVYGCADHDGVTTKLLTDKKTIYFQNNWKWTDLKLHYWYENGTDRWSTVVNGISLTNSAVGTEGEYDLFKFEIPAYVAGFSITGYDSTTQNRNSTPEIDQNKIINGNIYWMAYLNGGNHLSTTKYEQGFASHNVYVIGSFNDWSTTNVDSNYKLTRSADGKTYTGSFVFEKTVQIKLFNTNVITDNGGWINPKDSNENVELAPGTYTITYSVENNTFTFTRTIYLVPESEWSKDGAWFAAYAFIDGTNYKWYKMTKMSDGKTYKVDIDPSYPKVIFCRMNPASQSLDWNNKWNQTIDLTLGQSCYTITNPWNGPDGKATGNWSQYK